MRDIRGMLLLALVGVSVAMAPVHAASPKGKPQLMSFQEIWKVLEESPRTYTVDGEASGTYTEEVWPVSERPDPAFRVIKGAKGVREVRPLAPLSKTAQRQLDAAEVDFKAQNFEAAAKGYKALLKTAPGFFPAQLHLGDALLFGGEAAKALEAYELAAKMAPWHYNPWFFQASAMIRLGRFEEAADRYAKALSLRPSWPNLERAIESNGYHIGRKMHPLLLRPTARARLEGETITVQSDPDSRAWMAHAVCKGMWLGEPELRKKRTGSTKHAVTMLEETECLVILLAAHESSREQQPDPALDRVLEIARDGYLTELILYEVVGRVSPTTIPTLEEKQLARLHQFVSRYVLVPSTETKTNTKASDLAE